jgi:hypothetical protein
MIRERALEANNELLKQLQTDSRPVVVLQSDGTYKTITDVDIVKIKGGGSAISLS